MAQPLEQGRDVDLVVFVVAGQRIHHEVDAEAERHLALALAARRAGGRARRPLSSIAQAPAQSLAPMMTPDTPSFTPGGRRSTQTGPPAQRPGKSWSR